MRRNYNNIFYSRYISVNKIIVLFVGVLIFILSSCKKLVDVAPPVNSLIGNNVYSNDITAASVMTGIYSDMSSGAVPFMTGINGISIGAGLSADELTLSAASSNSVLNALYKNSYNSNVYPSYWKSLYAFIRTSNAVIEGVSTSSLITPAVNQQLLGEAKFIRAFCYFYLTNLYGDVPLVLGTQWNENSLITRISQTQVYSQIISDLIDAENLLSSDYKSADVKTSTIERVRPTKWVASALLSRVYLYNHEWAMAVDKATDVINHSSVYSLVTDLNSVFKKNSNEAIWQLQPVNSGWNTEDARTLILPTTGPNASKNPVFLDSVNLIKSFEPGDLRRSSWINSVTKNHVIYYYPFKYKSATSGSPVTEYLMVFRLAELYLIRAEALAQQNKLSEAQSDLNQIRARANLQPTTANDKSSLLLAILHEKQVELFTEFGHRWLDLKRTGNVDAIMNLVAPKKGATWNSNFQMYPIPLTDIQLDPNLIQNPGY